MTELEGLWDNLLSGEPERIRGQWRELGAEEQRAVLAHLERMISEEGWLPMQRQSARAALDALRAGNSPGGAGPSQS
jgi:hypothetical protein